MSFVVFLDVDGALNTWTTCEIAPSELYKGIDEARVKILHMLQKHHTQPHCCFWMQ